MIILKKLLAVILSAVILAFGMGVGASASFNSLIETEADVALLVNTDSDTVILDKNADKQIAPASITKIVTCIIVLEECEDLSAEVTCRREVLGDLYLQNASVAGIQVGETLTIEELLYCLMIPSGADAANMLADYVGGSIDEFVVMMNDYVKALGCENTQFINPHGLDGDGSAHTTANDLYIIAKHAIQNAKFREIVSTLRYDLQPTEQYSQVRYLNNTNKVMNKAYKDYYCEYVTGVKTGTSDLAGHCLLSTASKDGYNYMLILMNAPQYDIDGDGVEENVALTDTKKIYEWAFDNIVLTKVTSTTDVVTVIDVEYNWKTDHLRLVPAKEISTLVPIGTEAGSLEVRPVESETPKTVKAPVKKGDVLGKAEILYGEDVVATVDLVAAEDVSRSFVLWVWGTVKSVFSHFIVKIIFAVIAVLVIIYILLIIRKNRIKAKRRKIKMVKG